MFYIHYLHWLMDFLGINNTYNDFSTHMYNFWSGFGGNVSILALAGTLVALYRHHKEYLKSVHPMKIVEKPLELVHHNNDNEPK